MTARKNETKGPRREQPSAVIVLSGGAPNASLTAGALCAIYEKNKTFNVFYTSGAGSTIGLLYVAPKNQSTPDALKQVLRAGVDDTIYNCFPLGYKTFFKSGPFTVPFFTSAMRWMLPETGPNAGAQRLYNDWLAFWTAAVTPTDVSFFSQGLCAHFPFIKEAVDFEKLRRFNGQFYMNAYCIDDADMVEFQKHEIGPEHFDAVLSFPFVYPPTRIGDKHYYEGSAHDPINLPKLHAHLDHGRIVAETIVLIDILGALEKPLIRRPRNIIDAFGISIMTPIVSLALKNCELFRLKHPKFELLPLHFDIPVEYYAQVSDWSRSNMDRLWKIGYEAGARFCETHGAKLPDHVEGGADPI